MEKYGQRCRKRPGRVSTVQRDSKAYDIKGAGLVPASGPVLQPERSVRRHEGFCRKIAVSTGAAGALDATPRANWLPEGCKCGEVRQSLKSAMANTALRGGGFFCRGRCHYPRTLPMYPLRTRSALPRRFADAAGGRTDKVPSGVQQCRPRRRRQSMFINPLEQWEKTSGICWGGVYLGVRRTFLPADADEVLMRPTRQHLDSNRISVRRSVHARCCRIHAYQAPSKFSVNV